MQKRFWLQARKCHLTWDMNAFPYNEFGPLAGQLQASRVFRPLSHSIRKNTFCGPCDVAHMMWPTWCGPHHHTWCEGGEAVPGMWRRGYGTPWAVGSQRRGGGRRRRPGLHLEDEVPPLSIMRAITWRIQKMTLIKGIKEKKKKAVLVCYLIANQLLRVLWTACLCPLKVHMLKPSPSV